MDFKFENIPSFVLLIYFPVALAQFLGHSQYIHWENSDYLLFLMLGTSIEKCEGKTQKIFMVKLGI